jgi:cysteinyl-tRNA synthetase
MGMFSFLKKAPAAPLPPLRLHNSLSGELEEFVPISPREVKMYNCGPTVYEEQHIGNLRGPVLANVLKRTLALWGYKVKHVSNITDVGHLVSDADEGEDKIEAQAKKTGRKAQDIAEEITEKFFNDLDSLGIDRGKMQFTKATDYIPEQIALAQTLEQKGYAYLISDGLYFDTAKFKDYGELGGVNLSGNLAGARVDENPEKKNPLDFALWKLSPKKIDKKEKRQQEWKSPWGIGFPGWHLECTAMIFKTLGKHIDIHLGGIDLAPIHHNNEIAQAEAATAKPFVRYWMHNAFITIESKKISKSLGNTVYLHNIVDRGLSARALRYWYLTGHYRTQMNFTWEAIEGANQALLRLTRAFVEAGPTASPEDPAALAFKNDVLAAMGNDLDTPRALARMWELVKDPSASPAAKRASILFADRLFGLGIADARPSASLKVLEQSDLPPEILKLVQAREEARKNKEFAKADTLRGEIESAGYEIKDGADGSHITKK